MNYEEQLAKLNAKNRNFIMVVALVIVALFLAMLFYASQVGRERQALQAEQAALIKDETQQNRRRGDAIICILHEPPISRDQDYINKCLEAYGLPASEKEARHE